MHMTRLLPTITTLAVGESTLAGAKGPNAVSERPDEREQDRDQRFVLVSH